MLIISPYKIQNIQQSLSHFTVKLPPSKLTTNKVKNNTAIKLKNNYFSLNYLSQVMNALSKSRFVRTLYETKAPYWANTDCPEVQKISDIQDYFFRSLLLKTLTLVDLTLRRTEFSMVQQQVKCLVWAIRVFFSIIIIIAHILLSISELSRK